MRNEINPVFRSLLASTLQQLGFRYSSDSLSVEIDTLCRDRAGRPTVRYAMSAVTSHHLIRREHDAPTRIKISLSFLKDDSWSTTNSVERAQAFATYVHRQLEAYLRAGGTFDHIKQGWGYPVERQDTANL